MPSVSAADAGSASESAAELRSANIKLLVQVHALKRENAELQRHGRKGERFTPEELDATYVEERRQIERLEREVSQLKLQQSGARAHRR